MGVVLTLGDTVTFITPSENPDLEKVMVALPVKLLSQFTIPLLFIVPAESGFIDQLPVPSDTLAL